MSHISLPPIRRIYAPGAAAESEQGPRLKEETATPAPDRVQHSLLRGSPARVCEAIAGIDRIGVGGLMLVFRLGPMPYEVAANSIRHFMSKVAPEFPAPSVKTTPTLTLPLKGRGITPTRLP